MRKRNESIVMSLCENAQPTPSRNLFFIGLPKVLFFSKSYAQCEKDIMRRYQNPNM